MAQQASSGTVLVTGGAGFIGSHTCIELLASNFNVVVIDNLANSSEESLRRVKEIAGIQNDPTRLIFHNVDLLAYDALEEIFKKYKLEAAVHFAGLKAVGESVSIPIHYYENNISGTLNLLKLMAKYGVKRIVFSSSATVYGDPHTVPITEEFPLKPTNPYGRTKFMIEEIMRDLAVSDPEWKIILLRYFNPVGAHASGRIGEDPRGIPNNLMPYITQVAVGRRKELSVFGNDYATVDGTGVRDYIHVVDLAKGHIAAVKKISGIHGCEAINLGTGNGYSVLQVVEAMRKASSKDIPYKICPRRAGDIGQCFADPKKANEALEWKAEFGLDRMVEDAWRWQSNNPNGYSS